MLRRRPVLTTAVILTAGGLGLLLISSSPDNSTVQPAPAPVDSVAVVMETEPAAAEDSTVEVQLQINGVKSDQGMLRIAVFAGADGFPDHSRAVQRCSVEAERGEEPVTLSLPDHGEYAIAVYHDLDADEQLNRAAFGYPTEPYGFSRDARSTLGPPDYDAAAVQIESSGASLELTIR